VSQHDPQPRPRECPQLVANAALTLVLLAGAAARGQTTANQPLLDLSIPHPSVTAGSPQAGATFGWSMAMGDLDGSAGDELVVMSIFEDVTIAGTPYRDLGMGYAYKGTSLAAWNSYTPAAEGFLHAGQLFISIGTTRSGAVPRAFIGGMNRDVSYTCPPSTNQPNAGEIAEVNFNNGGVGYHYPPFEPSGPCPPAVKTFGHGSAVGDVNGDGVDDLVVGAHTADGGAGRAYVLFGGTTFPSGWVGFKLNSTSVDTFGGSVALADLDGDSNQTIDAIVVGAWERGSNGPGHAYVFRTSDIAGLTASLVHLLSSTQYQAIAEPSGATLNGFGWVVYSVGDVGGPSGSLDGFGDIAVHAEGGAQGSVSSVGSLTLFWGKTPGTSPLTLVDTANAVKLQVPSGYTPDSGERFGRGAATVNWEGSNPSGIKKGLLVGCPDADITVGSTTYTAAGRVFLFYVPITSSSGNAWSAALLEPDPSQTGTYVAAPQSSSRFGAWIVSGEYKSSYTGDQFVVCARQRTEGSAADVGRVYAFYRP